MIDAHVHLQMAPLLEHAAEAVARARQQGVRRLVVNGTKPADWPQVAELASRFPEVIACFGVHPWEVSGCGDNWQNELARWLASTPSAVGEVGLDRWIEPRDEAAQERVFRLQLDLARRFDRPVMIHCLRAWDWLQRVFAEEMPLPRGFLLHAYGGSPEMIPHFARQGAYFSFSGSTFEAKRVKLREALRQMPADRLLIETDAPAMLPPAEMQPSHLVDAEGKPANEPANLPLVYAAAARLRGEPLEQLRLQVWHNAEAFLGVLLHGTC